MRFPDADKLRRAKIRLKERGFKGEEESDEYWFEICEIYEKDFGGKVMGERPEKPKAKPKKKKAKLKPKPKPKKKQKKVKKAKKPKKK